MGMKFNPLTGQMNVLPNAADLNAVGGQNAFSVRNFDPKNYPYIRRAFANYRSGISNVKIAICGDSTTFGAGAGGATWTNATTKGICAQLAAILNARGLVAQSENWFGDGNTVGNANLATANPRLALSGSWSRWTGGTEGPGGLPLIDNGGNSSLAFTPNMQTDTVVVYYIKGIGNGTFTVDANGGVATNIDSNASTNIASVIVSTTLGNNTWNIKRVSGACYILGMRSYNSNVSAIEIWNMGRSGGRAQEWAANSTPYAPLNALTSNILKPDLAVINLGINNWEATQVGGSQSLFATNMTTIATTYRAAGMDVLFALPHWTNGVANAGLQTAYRNLAVAVAQSLGLAWIDFSYLDASYTTSSALGFMFDTAHCTASGYAQNAMQIDKIIRQFT